MNKDGNEKKGSPALMVVLSIALVFALSFVPWGRLSGGFVKDYNLLADIMPSAHPEAEVTGGEVIDPALLEAIASQDSAALSADTAMYISNDTVYLFNETEPSPGRVGDMVVIEDYTPARQGLAGLKHAVLNGQARIAVIGDSYIEGDIFTQDLRLLLQRAYGGRGVGYVPAFSSIPGFRRSVNVNGSDGWTMHNLSKGKEAYFTIASEYHVGEAGASVKYHGYSREPKVAAWSKSSVMFIAPSDGKITLSNDADTITIDVVAGEMPQFVTLAGETTRFTVKSDVPGLVYLGAWLEDKEGVTVDCMSVRGDSGITHRRVNSNLASQMRPYIDYDLIILEYGINALSSEQSDYSGYARLMKDVVGKIKECYPRADIIVMGVGDRGQKQAGQVHSMPTIRNMVMNQRRLAQETGTLFWDTREAMGGEDAIVAWRDRKLVNGDYIHLNSAGGRELAGMLADAIKKMLDE